MANFLPTLRELAITYNAFAIASARNIRSLGVTPSQFDVIAQLGNQNPMTCKHLGEITLMVKGTLTVVLDGLLKKGLIIRLANPEDARSSLITLSSAGNKLFRKIFPKHIAYLEPIFNRLSEDELIKLKNNLASLRIAFEKST